LSYKLASNAVKMFVEGKTLQAVPDRGVSERELAVLENTGALAQEEQSELVEVLLRSRSRPTSNASALFSRMERIPEESSIQCSSPLHGFCSRGFERNQNPDRERLLLAAAYHTAAHRKCGA
jgi:hypothetical protein